MILFIDTTHFNGLEFALIDSAAKTSIKKFSKQIVYNENYKTLAFLQQFLKKSKITPQQLSKIVVCSGPGSFTGIRVGVALGQAMGFALNIPVVAIKKNQVPKDLHKLQSIHGGRTITLHYGQKPNITKAKKR